MLLWLGISALLTVQQPRVATDTLREAGLRGPVEVR
jgi:hypothetical protein